MARQKQDHHWTPDEIVSSIEQFREWIFTAKASEKCLYHRGQMVVDQEDRPFLRDLGEYALLMSDFRAVILIQKRRDEGVYMYLATRTEFPIRRVPQAVATGEIGVKEFLTLKAVAERSPDKSARRAVRDALSCSEEYSQFMLEAMVKQGLIEDGRPPLITRSGRRLLL